MKHLQYALFFVIVAISRIAYCDNTLPLVEVKTSTMVGSGVVIKKDIEHPIFKNGKIFGHVGYVLTAFHVIEQEYPKSKQHKTKDLFGALINTTPKIEVKYVSNIISSNCSVVSVNKKEDTALIKCFVPIDIIPAKVATKSTVPGDVIYFVGLGGKTADILKPESHRRIKATAASATVDYRIYSDVVLIPGDSGGPIFNTDEEVVGIISGGWVWFFEKNANKKPQKKTWPGRGSNVATLDKLIVDQIR